MNEAFEEDKQVIELLERLKATPERDTATSANGKKVFLQQAEEISQRVSPVAVVRHKGWMLFPAISKPATRERKPMFTLVRQMIILAVFILGGSGLTVAAAQTSGPDDALYQLKLMSENTLMMLAPSAKSELSLATHLAERRTSEIQTQLAAGEVPSEALQLALRQRLDQSLQLAFSAPADTQVQMRSKFMEALKQQQQTMNQVQAISPDAEAALLRTRELINERLQVMQQLSESPMVPPNQIQNQNQFQNQIQNQTLTPVIESPAPRYN